MSSLASRLRAPKSPNLRIAKSGGRHILAPPPVVGTHSSGPLGFSGSSPVDGSHSGIRDRLGFRPLPLRVPTRRGRRRQQIERGRHTVRERAHRLPLRRRGGGGGGGGRRDVFRRRQGGQRQGVGGAGGARRPHHVRLSAARWERPKTHPIQERLMEFVKTVVLRRTRDLEDAIRTSKVDYEWRIHQLEHKIESVIRDLEEAREMTVELLAINDAFVSCTVFAGCSRL